MSQPTIFNVGDRVAVTYLGYSRVYRITNLDYTATEPRVQVDADPAGWYLAEYFTLVQAVDPLENIQPTPSELTI